LHAGGESFNYIPCLNNNESWIEAQQSMKLIAKRTSNDEDDYEMRELDENNNDENFEDSEEEWKK
jgi:hypothetical protein